NHTYVGTEHILLGLLREGDGVAARVLKTLEVNVETTRQEILKELDPNFGAAAEDPKLLEMATIAETPKPPCDSIDASKRYDVYCTERNQEIVYRNARFKGRKRLFPRGDDDTISEFLELEQANGETIFISGSSVIKFCQHLEAGKSS